jgi:hypothetical protein
VARISDFVKLALNNPEEEKVCYTRHIGHPEAPRDTHVNYAQDYLLHSPDHITLRKRDCAKSNYFIA